MKTQIIGAILVLAVVGGLYFFTEMSKSTSNTSSTQESQPTQTSPSDDAFRGLKIN